MNVRSPAPGESVYRGRRNRPADEDVYRAPDSSFILAPVSI